MANYFCATQKTNPRGSVDNVLEIFIDTYDIYRLNNLVAELGTYTFVVWYCSATDCNITFNVLGTSETVQSTTKWTKYVKTVEYDGANNNIDITQDLGSTIYLYEGYITKGTKDKSWSLAPEDWEDDKEERDNLINETMTFAQQTSDMFRWIVKDGTNETDFTLTSRTAELVSEQINLKGLVSFSGLNSELQDNINIINQWTSEEAIEGVTLINGGYIQTHTIKSHHIDTESLFADEAVIDKITSYEVDAERITSGLIKSNFIELYGLQVKQTDTNIVTLSIEDSGDITLRGSVESYNYTSGKSGWSISSNGDAEFNDVTVRGDLINAYGGILATEGDAKQVNAWFGASYEECESAPFIVYSDGSLKATKGEFGGVFTGDIKIGNISIVDPSITSGNDAIVTIQNGDNGVKRVQLRDTDISSFAQDIWITDNFENLTIQLGQDGHINAINGFVSGNNSFSSDGINIDGATVSGSSTNMNIMAETINVGTYNSDSNLKVWGNVTVEKDTRLNKDILLSNDMIISHNSDGFDINFVDNAILFVITFESNGGSSVAPIRDVLLNSKITQPTNPTRNGYTFGGWYKDSLLNVKFDFSTDIIEDNTVLYAKWVMNPAVAPTYAVVDPTDSSSGEWGSEHNWKTPYIISATVSDGGTLSYHWEINLFNGSNQLIALEDVFANKTSNNITVNELEEYVPYISYETLMGKCTITNTKGDTTASVVVEVYIN